MSSPNLHLPVVYIGCMQMSSTQCHRRSPNVAVKCHSRMELRPPTACWGDFPGNSPPTKRKILDRAG